ncbi:HdeD family acid-resistance protein [Actinomadura bangladeshensis]|uniref:HdeD family acid-resistance protein n=1 Tax=Actinomadura bangladeshensis TaxID=453573 RepID=A0A4V2XN65_9ACTN|nr:HdeD family acid-resistance protein [Actinomadura bangladeshensis]TDC16996.1 HdeD family acid-resistance protein [Actinomadura bangladeshensis]
MSTTSPRTGGTVPDHRQGTTLTHMVTEHQAMALALGGISFLLGVVVVAWPGVTVGVLAVLIGLQLIINGVVRIAQSVAPGLTAGTRTLMAVLGVLSLSIGVLAMRHLFQTVAVLAVLFGMFWLLGGIIEAVAVLSDRDRPGRGPELVPACLSVLAGIAVLAYPEASLVALTWLFGLWLITWGIIGVLVTLWIRRADRQAASAR